MKKKSTGNGKVRMEPKLECHLRLYDEYDRALRIFIEDESHKNRRSIQQQIRFMLQQALDNR